MPNDRQFCEAMLPKVSRTFALCIRLLPHDLEYPVLVAYLLCRIADTIEDNPTLDGATKRQLLHEFARCVGRETTAQAIEQVFADQRNDAERLAHNASAVLREYDGFPQSYRECIRPWVQEMCHGMASFASLQSGDAQSDFHALSSVEELDEYCYYVAGTVGHMLTDLYRAVRPQITAERHRDLKQLATSFGLGLQLTNIIKDVADDQARGWSFVPHELCQNAGIRPDQLQDERFAFQARQVMNELIDKAQRHLQDAREYCLHLPHRQYGIRLFCLTSMFFAVRTLRLARHDPQLLDPGHKVKISRRDVYWTVACSAIVATSNQAIRTYYRYLLGAQDIMTPLAAESPRIPTFERR